MAKIRWRRDARAIEESKCLQDDCLCLIWRWWWFSGSLVMMDRWMTGWQFASEQRKSPAACFMTGSGEGRFRSGWYLPYSASTGVHSVPSVPQAELLPSVHWPELHSPPTLPLTGRTLRPRQCLVSFAGVVRTLRRACREDGQYEDSLDVYTASYVSIMHQPVGRAY